jgi:hypothetical protein
MRTLIRAAIRCSIIFTAAAALLVVAPLTQAGFIVTLQQVGSNVVETGSGAVDLTGLTFLGASLTEEGRIAASFAQIHMAPPGLSSVFAFTGFTGPGSFGSGGGFLGSNFSGDVVGIEGAIAGFFVPFGYVSGTALSNSMTFNNATFASLGVTPGTYVWSWGTGLPNQNFTLQIGGAGVPDSGSTVSLLGCALLGLAALRRKLSC